MSRFFKHSLIPILLLLTVNLAVGFFTFRHYGLSWDEPYFYDYADSIRLAYSPQAFSPGFNFDQVYGPSAEDHKFYGPAYLLMARPVQQTVMTLFGADRASAWHLVNFLTFQIGLVFFYRLIRRWLEPWPAGVSTAFFAFQPVFWGHAFINPKDAPFMAFFLAALVLGLEFVDRLSQAGKKPWVSLFLAGLALGLTCAIRVIGPLAGAIILIYFLLKRNWRATPSFLAYGLIAALTMFLCWPYLWADPLNRLAEVLKHMSNNPTELAVLFMGQVFRANEMPRRYLPQLLALTLSEPTWILFLAGLIVAIRSFWQKRVDWRAPLLVLGLFAFMLTYLLYTIPSIYDGYRHFLFILPPIFVFAGFAFQWLWEKCATGLRRSCWAVFAVIMLLPGMRGIVHMHPYEYAYYNAYVPCCNRDYLAGGVGGAYRVYETEYWLTCYKEALEWARANAPEKTLHIQREFNLASYYGAGLVLKDLEKESETDIQPGDLLLFSTRANLDIRSVYRKLPVVKTFGRDGAEFCIIKRKD